MQSNRRTGTTTGNFKRLSREIIPGITFLFFPVFFAFALAAAAPAAAQSPAQSAPPSAAPAPDKPTEPKPAQVQPQAAQPDQTQPAPVAAKPDQAQPAPAATAPDQSAPEAAKPTAPAANPETPDEPKSEPGTGSSLIPHDLSPYGMFMNADVIVKVVMIGLAFASLVTWTILLAKSLELLLARGKAARALSEIAGAPTLREASAGLEDRKAPVARLAAAALAEADQSRGLAPEGVKERATALLARIEARAGRTMARGTGLLATIGSTAPFVGLFGTVWGIMNSFIGISRTHTTNLAVVAPGIAEALLATAFGLVAAIPAVVIYNFFARGITGYRSVLGDASAEVLRLLSRDLDRATLDGVAGGVRVNQAAE